MVQRAVYVGYPTGYICGPSDPRINVQESRYYHHWVTGADPFIDHNTRGCQVYPGSLFGYGGTNTYSFEDGGGNTFDCYMEVTVRRSIVDIWASERPHTYPTKYFYGTYELIDVPEYPTFKNYTVPVSESLYAPINGWVPTYYTNRCPGQDLFFFKKNTYDWTKYPLIWNNYTYIQSMSSPPPPSGYSEFYMIGWGKHSGVCDGGVEARMTKKFIGTYSHIQALVWLSGSDVPHRQFITIYMNDTQYYMAAGGTIPEETWFTVDVDIPTTTDPYISIGRYSNTTCYGSFYTSFADIQLS